jgi:DHA2 family multidrug resistance protein
LSTFPQRQHSLVTSVFGMSVVVGPIFGPMFGGYLAELYDWRWAFFMLVPMALAALTGLWIFLHDGGKQEGSRLDWTGFAALSIAIACLQLVLDRGERVDWFSSPEIQIEAALGIAAVYVFLTHSFTAKRPFLDLRLLKDRNYSLGLIIVTIYGMLNFTPMVILPPMLKELGGFPESVIGALLGFRGIGAVLGFFSAMWFGKLDPRVGITVGYLIQAWSGYIMMTFNQNTGMADVAFTSVLQGLAVGLVWVPLTTATFATLDKRFLPETSAVYHLLRNVGSSVFISLSVFTLIQTTKISYSELTGFINPFNEVLRFQDYASGFSIESALGLAKISSEIGRQAGMIGFLNAFWLYTFASLAVIPIAMLVKVPKRAVI